MAFFSFLFFSAARKGFFQEVATGDQGDRRVSLRSTSLKEGQGYQVAFLVKASVRVMGSVTRFVFRFGNLL